MAPKYPMDREPGVGRDAEHMDDRGPYAESESPQRSRRPEDDDNGGDDIHCGSPKSPPLLPPPQEPGTEAGAPPKEPAVGPDAVALRKENAALTSDLRDAREELQRRLEDLETQRHAEAEARARLKQLSKKRAGREAELEEQERERRGELERERAETERLRTALAALQAQRSSKEREEEEEEEARAQGDQGREDREQELVELNVQMKAQLSEARAQLALEREERRREEEEEERTKAAGAAAGAEEKAELSGRLAALQAELEQLKRLGGTGDVPGPEAYPATLGPNDDDELNGNMAAALCAGLHDNRSLLPSPELNRLFCLTANQLNAAASQATAGLILGGDQGPGVLTLPLLPGDPGASPMEGTSPEAPEEDATTTPEELSERSGEQDRPRTPSDPDLAGEVARLREEKTGMARRAEQSQAKLQALQSQVETHTELLERSFLVDRLIDRLDHLVDLCMQGDPSWSL